MDRSVVDALAKWPDVPHVYGWLALSARGQWRLRGEPVANAAIRDFIGRNYAGDEGGRWFFQNGPQRVYVELELAPWTFRLDQDGALRSHTGVRPGRLFAAALVDDRTFVLQTDLGAGNIDDRDIDRFLLALSDADGRCLDERRIEASLNDGSTLYVDGRRCRLGQARWPARRLRAAELPAAFGFVARPAAPGSACEDRKRAG